MSAEPDRDLFGVAPPPAAGSKAALAAKGYARRPGSGPAGETCGSCIHAKGIKIRSGRVFYKCEIIKHRWTSGPGTDIRLKSPACEMWEPEEKPLTETHKVG